MKNSVQTNIFDTFKIDYFISFATDKDAILKANAARENYYQLRGLNLWHINDLRALEKAEAQLCKRDRYIYNRYNEYKNAHETPLF